MSIAPILLTRACFPLSDNRNCIADIIAFVRWRRNPKAPASAQKKARSRDRRRWALPAGGTRLFVPVFPAQKLPETVDRLFVFCYTIEARLGKLPKYMGLDAGYRNAWIAHLLETKGIQGVIGYRRHTHSGEHYGKYRFRYDPFFDAYICPEHKHLYWKTTTREGYRQYFCDAKVCAACPRRVECFGKSMTRRVADRHVWQDALDDVIAFTKSGIGSRIYAWRKETIEHSFAEAKVNHGLRYARMLGIQNMREQCFLTAAVQNIKRLVASFLLALAYIKPCFLS